MKYLTNNEMTLIKGGIIEYEDDDDEKIESYTNTLNT